MTDISPDLEFFDATTLSASLTVNDLRTSLAWYRDVLGFTVTREFERDGKLFAVSLRAGVVPFLITQDDGARGLDRVKGAGLSLRLTTAQNIDKIAKRGWRTAGHSTRRRRTLGGRASFGCEIPTDSSW